MMNEVLDIVSVDSIHLVKRAEIPEPPGQTKDLPRIVLGQSCQLASENMIRSE